MYHIDFDSRESQSLFQSSVANLQVIMIEREIKFMLLYRTAKAW
jgi:hypothetical protein